MPELNDRMLGTSPAHTISYALHQTGSRLVGDRFLASYLMECLQIVDGLGPVHKLMLNSEGQKRGAAPEHINALLAQAEDHLRWAAEMKAEDYHRTNVLAFLGFWAAHEAGTENIIASILAAIKPAAESAVTRFGPGKYEIASWPWTEDQCLEIAQKLDQKAKDKTLNGGWNSAARLTTQYAWLGVDLILTSTASDKFNEASMVRNVILHRYGRLGPRDIFRFPHLAEFEHRAIQLTQARLAEYYQAVVDIHIAVINGITANNWK